MSTSTIQKYTKSPLEFGVRRVIDFTVAALGLLLISPLLGILALLIKLNSSGPIFYRGRRVGKDGEVFYLYKFRSMYVNADKQGPGITASGDSRITYIGSFLRRTKLDELPQLLNVLRGEMTLVGPRPEDPRYVALYTPAQRYILSVKPGITSAASLAYRHEEKLLAGTNWETTYCTQVLPAKLAIDLNYLAKQTLFSDFWLILRTIVAMLY